MAIPSEGILGANHQRFKRHFVPYKTPDFHYGRLVEDQMRGGARIAGISNGPIGRPIISAAGRKSHVVFMGLAKAIRRGSIAAVSYWWGVTPQRKLCSDGFCTTVQNRLETVRKRRKM